jgi:hypothetical protein
LKADLSGSTIVVKAHSTSDNESIISFSNNKSVAQLHGKQVTTETGCLPNSPGFIAHKKKTLGDLDMKEHASPVVKNLKLSYTRR